MSTESTGDVSLTQDEDLLRKMWQETDDFGQKKELRSHMYKIREARLKDIYNTGEETTTGSSESRSTTTTTRTANATGSKGSNLTTLADNLADHSFLSLKSKEIRDSESPTKDSYKIMETRKINDRDWNVVESNEASKDGKTHTTSRIATTSGAQNLDSGEMKYAAKSEQKASVHKDGDGDNFTKSVEASSRNVIRQEASGGDENSKFFSTSTTSTSSSKFSNEHRSTTGDSTCHEPTKDTADGERRTIERPSSTIRDQTSENVIRKVYAENVPNELKNHPNFVDGKTKVTTETRTLPDGSTVTTTRYETKDANQYSTSSSTSTSTSARHVSSATNEQKTSSNAVKSRITTAEDVGRDFDDRSDRSTKIVGSRLVVDKSNLADAVRKESHLDESDVSRFRDIELIGRDAKNVRNVEIVTRKENIPEVETQRTVTTTTITKSTGYEDEPSSTTVTKTYEVPPQSDQSTTTTTITKKTQPDYGSTSTVVTKTFTIPTEQSRTTTAVRSTQKVSSNYDKQQVASSDFLDSERDQVTRTTKTFTTSTDADVRRIEPAHKETVEIERVIRTETETSDIKPRERESRPALGTIEIEIIPTPTPSKQHESTYNQPDRRQPIKPGKSELDERTFPTEGQYDTTYRTDYIPKRISVDVSPTHDAFARSLRSVSPDRLSKTGSTRSLRTTSNASLVRSTDSPDRQPSNRGPSGGSRPISPGKRIVTRKTSESPEKKSPQKITKHTKDTADVDNTVRKQKVTTTTFTTATKDTKNEVDSSTLTKRHRPAGRPRSRSTSPTSIASDIEFIRHRTDIVTDLDVDETNRRNVEDTKFLRRHTEEFNKRPSLNDAPIKKPQKITDKSATLPLTDLPAKRTATSPVKEPPAERTKPKAIRRTDTYEERCKEMLGIADASDTPRKQSVPRAGMQPASGPKKDSEKNVPKFSLPERDIPARKSPQKEPIETYPAKLKDNKKPSSVQEFPSQIRRSPQKEPLDAYPQKTKYDKKPSSVQEFPSQIRKIPKKEPLQDYPGEKSKDDKKPLKVQEFPSQIRRSPQKEPLEDYPGKPKDKKQLPPKVQEFPSQIRTSPAKEPLEDYPERTKDKKQLPPKVQEFPSQIRRSPQKEPLEDYPEKPKDNKQPPSVEEFPSQIRRSPQKEQLEDYPEKPGDNKQTPSVQEFPSQIRRSPQKESFEDYPEKPKDEKKPSKVQEFPSQIRRSPEKEPLEPYPEKATTGKKPPSVEEFPSQVKKSPQKEPLEDYPQKPKENKKPPSVAEFPSRIGRLQQIEKPKDDKKSPSVEELPSQVKPSSKEVTYKPATTKTEPEPSRCTPAKESKYPEVIDWQDYPEEISSDEGGPLRKGPNKVSLDDLPNIKTDKVSLDDIPVTKKGGGIPRKPAAVIDSFITNEKTDTEITLKQKYSNESIHRPMGIPDVTKKPTVAKKTQKIKSGTTGESETDSSEEEEEIEETTVDDVERQIIGNIIEKEIQQRKKPMDEKPSQKKVLKPKLEPGKGPMEDFITVSKAQLLQSESKIPIEEPIHCKKFISILTTKEEETDRLLQKKKESKPISKGIPLDTELVPKPNKTIKKTNPPGKIQVTASSVDKKKGDLWGVKVNCRRTDLKVTPKKKADEKVIATTEYTDQYTTKTKDKSVNKPIKPKPALSRIVSTPTKQPETKKTILKHTVNAVGNVRNTTIHVNVQKADTVSKRTTTTVGKLTQIDRKSKVTQPKIKPIVQKQPQTPSVTARTTVEKTVDVYPAKRHVVSTIINIKPKTKPETITKTIHKTTATKTILAPKTIKTISKQKLQPATDVSTDEEESDIENIGDVSARSTLRTANSTSEKRRKCITTKSILIENAVADQREIIVDLKRSKSSREGTPDRICPYPVSVDSDSGVVRYPDRVIEPDDHHSHRLKPKRISDIPLVEREDVDESLLSVNEKVHKFLSTAEQVTMKPSDAKPAPKVERPILDVDDSLREDECLLSVSDKVHKFITTAEQLAGQPNVPDRSRTSPEKRAPVDPKPTPRQLKSPEKTPERQPDSIKHTTPERAPPTDQIRYKTPERKFSDSYAKRTTEETSKFVTDSFDDDGTPKTSRRLSKDDSKTVLSPTGRLRSTESIKRAKALFENIGKEQETLVQKDILSRPSVFEGRQLKRTEEKIEESRNKRTGERVEDRKLKDQVRTKLTYEEVQRSPSPDKRAPRGRSPSLEELPHYMTPLDRTVKEYRPRRRKLNAEGDDEGSESDRSRSTTPDRNIPHYMLPLDRSLRERSPHKENVKQLEDIMNRSFTTTYSDETESKTTKFDVTLKRTDSGRMVTVHRKLSTSSVDDKQRSIEDLEVEEIFDLEYLEKLLETIVGYDIRKRIRVQIRLIKRAIEENTLESLIVSRHSSPAKEIPYRRPSPDKNAETIETRRYSSTFDKRNKTEKYVTEEVSEYQSSYEQRNTSSRVAAKTKSVSPARNSREPSPKKPKEKSRSPERKSSDRGTKATTTTTKIFQTELKKTKPVNKAVSPERKPEWVTRNTLRKVNESSAPAQRTPIQKAVTKKEREDGRQPTDVITSGYGVGPTDENGTPLFGLKALRAQNISEKSKVQGTVIRSQFYSENGADPEGEIVVTEFSTDPDDLGTRNVDLTKGIASVTTTKKFGGQVTGKNKKASGQQDVEYKSSVKTSKIARRGSVKEISQKFIENAVETLKSEKQSSYPKAGLILRTSSFKDSPTNGTDSRGNTEGPPATAIHQKVVTSAKKTVTSSSDDKTTETFLTNKSKVTGVQDVISRMKNEADIDLEETEEDVEARNLLNKFIGSQVLLSGMESCTTKSPVVTVTATTPGGIKRTTKITTTTSTSESSKPTIVTRTFTHPITAELLDNVWDEQTLKLLLEQSTDYEDRRIIRARLREVMAEQEACADLVEKASDEPATIRDSGSTVHGTTTRTTTYSEGPVTTTSQVTTRMTTQEQIKKPMSPFAKFRQLDKQNSLNSPPSTPKSPTGGGPLFKFTDPSLNQSANTVKQRLLQWCQMKTKEYENIQLDNFSTSWSDGMAFCALIHHFLPDAFDFYTLNPRNRRHNFTLAFRVADEKAGIAPLLDVDDMVAISRPDWKCVFTYVQSIYRRFKDED